MPTLSSQAVSLVLVMTNNDAISDENVGIIRTPGFQCTHMKFLSPYVEKLVFLWVRETRKIFQGNSLHKDIATKFESPSQNRTLFAHQEKPVHFNGHITQKLRHYYVKTTSWRSFWRSNNVIIALRRVSAWIHISGHKAYNREVTQVTALPVLKITMLASEHNRQCPCNRKAVLWGPFYYHGLTSKWIINNMFSKVRDEITYPFPHFNECTVIVRNWINNLIPHIIKVVITYPSLWW